MSIFTLSFVFSLPGSGFGHGPTLLLLLTVSYFEQGESNPHQQRSKEHFTKNPIRAVVVQLSQDWAGRSRGPGFPRASLMETRFRRSLSIYLLTEPPIF